MIANREKPGVAFWATMALVVIVLYVLCIGPACWISSHTGAGDSAVSVVYRPLTWGMSNSKRIEGAISWYSQLAAAKDWTWVRSRVATNQIRHWELDGEGLDKWLYSPEYRAINRNLGVD